MKLNNRIVGGERAEKPIPWQVRVFGHYKLRDGRHWKEILCGGTILNEDTILTAAHCFNYGN